MPPASTRRAPRARLAALLLAVATTATGCAVPSEVATPSAGAGTALSALEELDVKGRAPKTGYDRDEFGPAWADVDHNGCDTRNDILRRDLTDITTREGTQGCIVLTGTFHDPYSGTTIEFRRGEGTSAEVQIDHVVALSDAWQKGAQRLSAEERRQFANDPLNLLASDGSLNQSKGDSDAATWLPPHKPFRCAYVARQVAVKRAYDLWVTRAEHDAIARVLGTCPEQELPTEAGDPTVPPAGGGTGGDDAGTTSYANCDEARAAGAAPVHEGDPGYSRALDRDGDGVGCV